VALLTAITGPCSLLLACTASTSHLLWCRTATALSTTRATALSTARPLHRHFRTQHAIHEIGGPRVRNHHAGIHHRRQRNCHPDAEDMVPVKIARLGIGIILAQEQAGLEHRLLPDGREP